MRKFNYRYLTKYERFLKIYHNSYFKDFLYSKGICPLGEDHVYELIKDHIDEIQDKPKKSQFSKLPAAFIISPIDNIETSIKSILSINGVTKNKPLKEIAVDLYGKDQALIYNEIYTKRLKNRPKPSYEAKSKASVFSINHWLSLGYSYEEAKEKVSKIQSDNANKRNKENYKDKSNYSGCIEYWLKRGYSYDDSIKHRDKAIFKMNTSIESFKYRHGEKEGLLRYNKKNERFKSSMLDENGIWKGYVRTSKESLKFFLPIYKFLRKHGIKEKDIYWGIKGSKEYFLSRGDSSIYSYDFTILPLRLIIEYHGEAWHPIAPFEIENRRIVSTFINGYSSVKDMYYKDIDKMNLARYNNFNIYPIWSDETNKHHKIISIIKEYLNE